MQHSCGHPQDVCADSARVWHPQRRICYVEMEEAAARRTFARIHEDNPYHNGDESIWSAQCTAATPYHFADGVHIYVSEVDLDPTDDFLTPPRQFASPND